MELRILNIVNVNFSFEIDSLNAFKGKTMWEVSEKNSVGGDVEVSWVDTDLQVEGLVVVKWVGVGDLVSPCIINFSVDCHNLLLLESEVDVKSDVSTGDQVDDKVLFVLNQSIDSNLKSAANSEGESKGSWD